MGALTDRAAGLLAAHRWAAGPTLVSTMASGTAAATTLVIARGIGAAAFGQFTVVLSIALIVTVGMLTSLNYVMFQELPRAEPGARPALVTTALLATLVLGAVVFAAGLAAAPLLTAVLGVDTRTLAFALALALSMTLNQLTESFLRGLKRFRLVAGLKLAVAVVYLGAAACCLLVFGVRDAEPYLVALIGTNLVFALVSAAGFEVVPRSWSWALARSLYRHGAYVTAIAALTAVVFGVDVIFLNHWAPRADVGVYSVYNGFPKRLLGVVFTDGIGLVLLPTLATLDKPAVMRRIARLAPVVFAATAVFSFAASTVFFLLVGGEYPYALGLMALSALGIGAHTVFNLQQVALTMDGVRGAKVLIGCLLAGTPLALACQAALIAWQGLIGGLVAFALSNLVLVAVVTAVSARLYRPAGASEVRG
ncbi:oligosaccharide flippase family protein [Microbispora hainanensis]|uniref:Oligosaccharide flippase family protein n=1 Tax=Microbispora hainanensis TaxID=568844 RepID=A0ABZ1SKH1_9ACTN|nr:MULTISPECIES: oligosaccharide flippase family protein [Microbispora]NJP28488.1 oligosaccharide flippase family protein [Microbispora sp. CL1-1]